MPKRKCPACGSVKIVKILYGMPSHEAFEAEQRGELVLGGCCILPDSPDRACKHCGQQFGGSNAYLKNGIRCIEFFIGGFSGTSHYIYMDGKRKKKILKYARTPGGFMVDIRKQIQPEYYLMEDVFIKEVEWPNVEWGNFIDEIAACEVNHWKDDYFNDMVLDGTQWHIKIKLPKRKKIYKSGSNAYPPAWKKFVKVMQKYVDESIE